MECDDSSTDSPLPPQLPPGFRFHPTDEELVVHYLKKKVASAPLPVSIIADIDLYKFDPWELPARAIFGEQEWYFFSPRDRKYPNGARPNRAATSGYWKATGTDKPVYASRGNQKVGLKKSLVFYTGKPPKGIKTNWIMHEYRLADIKSNPKPTTCHVGQRGFLRLDDCVLCRIYKKPDTPSTRQQIPMFFPESPQSMNPLSVTDHEKHLQGIQTSNYIAFLENENNMFDRRMIMSNNNGDFLSQSLSISEIPMIGASSVILPVRQTQPEMYWNHEHFSTSPAGAKRFLVDESDEVREDDTNTIASLLGQQAMLGSLEEGTRTNWYS